MFLNRFQASSTTQLVGLHLNLLSGGTTFQLGIYSDNGAGTLPVSLLGDTGPKQITGIGWNNAALPSPVNITNGTYYWLAFHTDAGFVQDFNVSYPNQADWNIGTSYGPFGASFGGAIDGTGPIRYSLYGTTCP